MAGPTGPVPPGLQHHQTVIFKRKCFCGFFLISHTFNLSSAKLVKRAQRCVTSGSEC